MVSNALPSLLLFVSALLYWAELWTSKRRFARAAFGVLVAGTVLGTLALFTPQASGITLVSGLEGSLFRFAWFIAVVYVASELWLKLPVLGAFVAPLLFLLTIPQALSHSSAIPRTAAAADPLVTLHIALVLLGGGLFAVAFVAGTLYLFQERRLKAKHVGRFLMKLPSITKLDSLNLWLLLTGFPLLTVGIAVGIASAKQAWGVYWKWDYKGVGAIVTWLIFAALIHGRLVFGWKGRKAAAGAILGFIAIVATVLVSSYFTASLRLGP